MRIAVVLLAVACAASAQEDLAKKPVEITEISPGGSRRAMEIVQTVYQSPAIREQCLKTPTERLDVALNGYRVPVDCALWMIWYKREQERAQQ